MAPLESPEESIDDESSSLLSRTRSTGARSESQNHARATDSTIELSALGYLKYLFCQDRFVVGMVSYIFYSMLVTGFDTTLPLHIRATFHWGSLPAGLLFIGLQLPGILLTPLCGWLKDRVGTRYPTGMGFLLLTPLLWLVGVPGDRKFPWAGGDSTTGKVLYIVSITGVGCLFSLLNGLGFLEATCK
jgi:nitrate/nitrite transporter NarK